MTILVRLPHFIAAAVAAEEVGKAAGSTKLRGLGLPLPYTDRDGSIGVVRLWARWEKQRDGAAKLLGFDVRCGKERSGDRMLELRIRAHDGALVGYAPGRMLERLEELSRRLLDAEAAGRLPTRWPSWRATSSPRPSTPLAAAVAGCSPILCRSKPASVPSAARPSTSCSWSGGGRHDSSLPRERGCWNADQT